MYFFFAAEMLNQIVTLIESRLLKMQPFLRFVMVVVGAYHPKKQVCNQFSLFFLESYLLLIQLLATFSLLLSLGNCAKDTFVNYLAQKAVKSLRTLREVGDHLLNALNSAHQAIVASQNDDSIIAGTTAILGGSNNQLTQLIINQKTNEITFCLFYHQNSEENLFLRRNSLSFFCNRNDIGSGYQGIT
jgi:hypothetical protein